MSGGSTKKEEHSVQSNAIDPAQLAKFYGNSDTANAAASQLTTPYTGRLVADFNPTQTQAQGILSALATNPLYGNQIQNAANTVQGILGQDTFSQGNLQKYFNPYQSDVINATLADQERARQIAQVRNAQQDTAGDAFGGSRSGVSRSLTDEAYDRNTGTLLANLNDQGWQQAVAMAQQDLQNRLGAAGQLVNTAGAGYNQALQQGGLLANVGDVQQQQQQAGLNAEWQRYLQNNQNIINAQGLRNQALGIIPIQQTQTSDSTSKTSSNPGLGGILGAVGGLAMSAAVPGSAGLFGSSSLLGSIFGKSNPNTLSAAMPYLDNGMGGLGG